MRFECTYDDIISIENLLAAWKEFVRGKRSREDVLQFERNLMANILSLHGELKEKTYTHSPYHYFRITDPKVRDIHKASVRDRLLHHAIHRKLSPFFEKRFIADSYSCQNDKGTHRALLRFRKFINQCSKNSTKTVWVLKCDIRKFFARIDQRKLLTVLERTIEDRGILWLLARIIQSFHVATPGVGLPLGNLTSQLFVNVYMNEFDQFVKHRLKARYYIRYADDFVVLSTGRLELVKMLLKMNRFLNEELALLLHPNKTFIQTVASGVDFLGWVHFSDHRVVRGTTKRRMLSKLQGDVKDETLNSYLGHLRHGNSQKLQKEISNRVLLRG